MERSWQNDGARPPGCDKQAQPSSSGTKLRMPTVHDALPYTPLSSIVPFSPDIIQPPTAAPLVQSTAFSTYGDVQKSQGVLQQLSLVATNAETASKRCEQSIRDVQRLLDPESLTQYLFKGPKRSQTANVPTEPTSERIPVLGPFAEMVLANTTVSFRYLTQGDPPAPQLKQQVQAPTSRAAPALPTPQFFAKPTNVLQIGLSRSQSTGPPSSSQQRQVSAVIPKPVSQAQRAEHQYMPDQDSVGGAQYLTPSKPPYSSNTKRATNLAQRQQGDLAVEALQNLLAELFQAEDQIEPDTSGHVPALATLVFEPPDTDSGSPPKLRPETQSKLEAAVNKVVKYGQLSEVHIEHLLHAQRLCEVHVATVDSLAFSIGDDWSDEDTHDWLHRIGQAEIGLAASRTLTRIMTGGAHLKALQSEDYLGEVLNALSAVVERCIVPIIEESPILGEKVKGEKGGHPANPKFVIAYNNRQILQILLNGATRAMRYLGELLIKTDIDESTTSRVEFLCKAIIFAENASVEKDSSLGVQSFENLRICTMDVYASIFTKYTSQRRFILDEILASLERLPATKQSARQYRLGDSKPIQLVSALLMRLIQTSATRSKSALKLFGKDNGAGDEAEVSGEESRSESASGNESVNVSPKRQAAAPRSLASLVSPLHDAAQLNASHVVTTLMARAVTASKSSDEPYRKLLDIFTEDFLNVLGSSNWPAAELLLRTLVQHMIAMVESPKSSVPSRTMSLELLGVIGSGIIEMQMKARQASQVIDGSDPVVKRLKEFAEQSQSGIMEMRDLVALDGPYRVWAEYLNAKGADEDPLLQSAHGYMLMEWASTAVRDRDGFIDSGADDTPGSAKHVQNKLREMLVNPNWLDDCSTLQVGTSEGCLAALVATMNSKLCKAFHRIFQLLLASLASEHSTVRSRSLKSIVTLLEKDTSILDRNTAIMNHILRCAQDKSPLVRESALGLVQKCVTLRPELDKEACANVIDRTKDAAVGVRKRAIRMLKDMYLRNEASRMMCSAIADAIISRIADTEEGVVEIARTTMEEVWFQPFYGLDLSGQRAVATTLAYRSQAALLVATVDRVDNAPAGREDDVTKVLEALIKRLISTSKTAKSNIEVCRTLVAVLSDGIIDNNDIPGSPTQGAILRGLTIFARASPQLFTAPQLERLEPYTQNLTQSDELEIYRYVITILRNVMPNLTMMKTEFLQTMQSTLLKSSTRLQKPELREVAPCLWTINKMLGNVERLVNFLISVLQNINKLRNDDLVDKALLTKVSRLMVIASEFGNACDFDNQLASFKAKGKCDWYKGSSVSELIVETLCSFTSSKRPLAVRRIAIDGICTVAQAWPKQFLRADVIDALETVFKDGIPELEEVLLAGLEGFFVAQEVPDENVDASDLPTGISSGTERLGRTYVASDQDGASTSLAQRFLGDVLRIALSSYNEPAFIAARLVISVNKQGLVHPKESGPALVALETCPNKTVASEAFKEHKAQHQKHESLFEKEYMRAVQQVFDYQTKIIGDSLGYTSQPPVAKMHLAWEVLKAGKAQVRKKFMTSISQKLNFDSSKIDTRAEVPDHLAFVRFCSENLAFFEYDKVEDILHLLACLEKTFSGSGSSVAQAIESEVLKMQVGNTVGLEGMAYGTSDTVTAEPFCSELDPIRLRQLSISAQILSITWETRSYLRRVWNVQKYIAKSKGKDKDVVKSPNRATNATALTDAYLKRIGVIMDAACSESEQRAICGAFVELISVDSEVKVGSDDENAEGEISNGGYETPSETSSRKSPSVHASGGGKGRKRKASVNAAGTPRKRGKAKKLASFNQPGNGDDDGGWD